MRRQFIAALTGLAVFTLALYVIPRTITTVDSVRASETRTMERAALLIGRGVQILLEAGVAFGPESFPALVQPGEELTIKRDGAPAVVVGAVEGQGLVETHSVRRRVGDITVTLRRSAAETDEEVRQALRPVPYLAGLALAVAVGLAVVVSGRLVRPFTALSRYTEQVGVEDGSIPPAPRSSLPEANALADALEERGMRLLTLIQRERQFSANASHQLRTPLAALRLRLEDLSLWPETPDVVRDELEAVIGEADRLSGTIQDLLTFARSGGIGAWDGVDVNEVAGAAAERWRELLAREGRAIEVELAGEPVTVASSARSLGELLNVVLENSLSHGRGTVRVSVRDRPDSAVIAVADEGTFGSSDGSSSTDGFRGEGIGLGLADVIAEAVGARLVLVDRSPTTFELRLPHRGPGQDAPPTGDA